MIAWANGFSISWDKFLFGYLIFFLAHLSLHFSNDYFDRESDAKSKPTALSGGTGVLVSNPEMAPFALHMALSLLLASGAVAVAFTLYYDYSPAFLVFAILGALLGWFYTAPPLKFAYRGLGELSTMIAVGLVMPGMGYFVISGSIDAWFLVLSLPLFCYGLFFILTVEMPDMEVDAMTGKRGYVVRFGRRRSALTSLAACITASLLFVLIYATGVLGEDVNFGLIALFSLVPLGVAGLTALKVSDDKEKVVSQVKLNFASLVVFLLLMSLVLLYVS
ncbi:MAG: prenyltransferase [Methanomassiliicoccales archaeon]|nr:prenyltransferase [Methanomassiliicoccales archaeon]